MADKLTHEQQQAEQRRLEALGWRFEDLNDNPHGAKVKGPNWQVWWPGGSVSFGHFWTLADAIEGVFNGESGAKHQQVPSSLRPVVLVVPGGRDSQGLPERILFFEDHNDAWDVHGVLGVYNWMMRCEVYRQGEKPELPPKQKPLFTEF